MTDPWRTMSIDLTPVAAPALARAGSATRRSVRGTPKVVRIAARYDAARTNSDNVRHWSNADDLSAVAANSADVRRVLRRRARYEVDNNSYAKGIVLTLANDVVGTGPTLQMLSPDQTANRLVEKRFAEWSKAVGYTAKLRTGCQAKVTNGENVTLLVTNPKLPTPVKLDLDTIEADRLATPDLWPMDENAVDGVVFDAGGNPVEYHVLKSHPGDPWGGTTEYDRVAARNVLHRFRRDRPGQRRGIPDITPALPLFAELRRYTLAVLAAAETAADFTALLQSQMPPDEDDAQVCEAFDLLEIDRRMMTVLPSGYTLAQMRAEQPTTTYAMFKREILNEIARCLNVTYAVAAGNSSDYNYASGRMDYQIYDGSIRVERSDLEAVELDPVFAAWCNESDLVDPEVAQVLNRHGRDHIWFWPGREHVDPLKEAGAQAVRLANNTTTLADEYARKGQDWEDRLRQIAKERALMAELKLTPADVAAAAAIMAAANEFGDEG